MNKCSLCDREDSKLIRLYSSAKDESGNDIDLYLCSECAKSYGDHKSSNRVWTNTVKTGNDTIAERNYNLLLKDYQLLKKQFEALKRENYGLRQQVSNLKEKEENRYKYDNYYFNL